MAPTLNALACDFVDYPEPHLERTRKLLRAHPEVRTLFGPARVTALLVFFAVGVQLALAYAVRGAPLWAVLAVAWGVGAFANHMLWVLIHDCTHNLVFRSPRANAWLQIFANGPIVFPAAASFRKFHLLHHRFQGVPELDADLAAPFEARFVQNSPVRKAFWLLTFFAWQAARVPRLKRIHFLDGWYAVNLIWQVAFVSGVFALAGWRGVLFMTLASVFAIGLHPVGARWIQEHYLTSDDQETFSYYGPLNVIALNVGYHNEHHDLMTVPWMRLPRIKAMAPEFYDSLRSHTSWAKLLVRFIVDPKLSLYSRRTREAPKRGLAARRVDGVFTEAITTQAQQRESEPAQA